MNRLTRVWAAIGLATLTLSSALYVAPVAARVVVVDVRTAPPPPRFERVPPPRAGYVWAPGYWRWNGRAHVWTSGYWIRSRPGYRYVPGGWVHAGPNWRYHPGYWGR